MKIINDFIMGRNIEHYTVQLHNNFDVARSRSQDLFPTTTKTKTKGYKIKNYRIHYHHKIQNLEEEIMITLNLGHRLNEPITSICSIHYDDEQLMITTIPARYNREVIISFDLDFTIKLIENPNFVTSAVRKICQVIQEDRSRFVNDAPILADALEEGGCNDPDILMHFRYPALHLAPCILIRDFTKSWAKLS